MINSPAYFCTGRFPMFARCLLAVAATFALTTPVAAQFLPKPKPLPPHTHAKNEIYGNKDGMALIMDVFTPNKSNGAGVILIVSMSFQSNREMLQVIQDYAAADFLDRGYVVFAVLHGSQPKFTVPEIVEVVHRAVRFIKHNAERYHIRPENLAAAGGSSGGLLALMTGCGWKLGNPDAPDPVERQSSKVAAVACFFPVTDFRTF